MKNFILSLILLITSCGFLAAQVKYQSHRVKQGETVFSLSQQYGISREKFLQLNPEAKNNLKTGSFVIVPVKLTDTDKFREHKVKRKETLFSLSRQYGVSKENLKRFNKHLYTDESLKRGEVLKIPIAPVAITKGGRSQYVVKAGDTKYSIARRHGTTVEALEAANPATYGNDDLPVGLALNLPKSRPYEPDDGTVAGPQEDPGAGFMHYEVKPLEGFFRLKVKFGLGKEEIIALNPHAADGLKTGMLLKLPIDKVEPGDRATPRTLVKLDRELNHLQPKNIVLILPFQMRSVYSDSIPRMEDKLKGNTTSRIAIDFYAGALLAVEAAKKKGISTNLYVLDYDDVKSGIAQTINRKGLQDVDAVIGPLRQNQVGKVASELERQNIPVISPLSTRQGTMYKNSVQSIPPEGTLADSMLEYLKANGSGKKIVIISDGSGAARAQKVASAFSGSARVSPRDGGYFKREDLLPVLDKQVENWVVLESSNASVVSNAVRELNSLRNSRNIRLFTLNMNNAFRFGEVSNMHLANLNFTFPSVSKSYNLNEKNGFVSQYKSKYGYLPNRFAARGYDVTYDTLLRLAFAGNLYDAAKKVSGYTEYNENKFFYRSSRKGLVNNAVYILQYNKDLEVETVSGL